MKNLKTLEFYVIAQNKKLLINLVIRRKDFIKIENGRLYLKDDDRILYINEEQTKSLIYQYNLKVTNN